MKEEMIHVLHALADAFQEESDREHFETVKKIIEDNHHLDITKPEMFGLLTSITLEEQKDLMARIALANVAIDSNKFHEVSFVYTHYTFIEQHLDRIIVAFEGFACSADKTRWLIDSYRDFVITGNLPVIAERNYWHPRLLDAELWMKWMGTFETLYYGNEEEYVNIKHIIKERYETQIKQQKETLHTLFTAHTCYRNSSQEERHGETKTGYHFEDSKNGDKGTILVNSIGEISYRFYLANEQRFAKYGDTLPQWFKSLIVSS